MRWDCVEKRRMESYNAKGGKNIQYFVWLGTKDDVKNRVFLGRIGEETDMEKHE